MSHVHCTGAFDGQSGRSIEQRFTYQSGTVVKETASSLLGSLRYEGTLHVAGPYADLHIVRSWAIAFEAAE